MANPTIGATTPRIQYTATASQTVFTVPFEFLANADLAVYVNGTLKTLTTDYTLTGANTTGGGSLTFVTGRTAGDIVTILGNLAYSRDTNKYTKYGLLPAEVLEADFDALQVQAKQLALADQFALRAPLTDTGSPAMTLPVVATRASKALGFDASGNPTVSASSLADIDSTVQIIDTLNALPAGASSSISYQPAGTGAVTTTVQAKLRETVSVKDFGAVGDGVTDDTAAIQAALDYCDATVQNGAREVYIPGGKYKITDSLVLKNEFVSIRGDGAWASEINFNGVAGAAITTSAITYLRPYLRDFAIRGNISSGKGIDFSNITGEVYLGELKDLYIEAGSDGLYAPNFFSMVVQNVSSYSYNGHCFRVACGPGVSWTSCYALASGSGKAGYRLAGTINMFGCNGVNASDYWGVFGNDTASADGFQSDFPGVTDYPDINLFGCNVENFGSLTTAGEGIRVQGPFRSFNVIGGKIDRFGLSTAYSALIRCRASSNGNTEPAKLSFGSVFLGSGTPSNAYLYSDSTAKFWDQSDSLYGAGVTSFKNTSTTYPIMRQWVAGDIYGDNAHYFTAISPRRMSQQVVRYVQLEPTVVGSNQVVDVTGYTKLKITPAAAATVRNFTFTETPNTVSDYLRNGELIIEAGNANLTLVHNWGTRGMMRMKSGASKVMALGDIARFVWSDNAASGIGGWVET